MNERKELVRFILCHPELLESLEEILQGIKKQTPAALASEEPLE